MDIVEELRAENETLKDAIFEYACSVIEAEGISFLDWMETPHLQEAIIAILDARDPNWRDR